MMRSRFAPCAWSSSRELPRSSSSASSRCSVATKSSPSDCASFCARSSTVRKARLGCGPPVVGVPETRGRLSSAASASARSARVSTPDARQDHVGDGVLLGDEGEQQVRSGQLRVAPGPGALDGALHGLLGLDGELGEVHGGRITSSAVRSGRSEVRWSGGACRHGVGGRRPRSRAPATRRGRAGRSGAPRRPAPVGVARLRPAWPRGRGCAARGRRRGPPAGARTPRPAARARARSRAR